MSAKSPTRSAPTAAGSEAPAPPARDDAALKKKLQPLIELQRDLEEKLMAVTTEIDEILGGGAGIGAKLKQVEAAWKAVWSARYQGEYVFDYAKDRAQIKRLLTKAHFTPEDLTERMGEYIKDGDPFYVSKKHPFAIFVSTVNRWARVNGHAPDFDSPSAVGCHHQPPCQSDQEHTRRRQAELRA